MDRVAYLCVLVCQLTLLLAATARAQTDLRASPEPITEVELQTYADMLSADVGHADIVSAVRAYMADYSTVLSQRIVPFETAFRKLARGPYVLSADRRAVRGIAADQLSIMQRCARMDDVLLAQIADQVSADDATLMDVRTLREMARYRPELRRMAIHFDPLVTVDVTQWLQGVAGVSHVDESLHSRFVNARRDQARGMRQVWDASLNVYLAFIDAMKARGFDHTGEVESGLRVGEKNRLRAECWDEAENEFRESVLAYTSEQLDRLRGLRDLLDVRSQLLLFAWVCEYAYPELSDRAIEKQLYAAMSGDDSAAIAAQAIAAPFVAGRWRMLEKHAADVAQRRRSAESSDDAVAAAIHDEIAEMDAVVIGHLAVLGTVADGIQFPSNPVERWRWTRSWRVAFQYPLNSRWIQPITSEWLEAILGTVAHDHSNQQFAAIFREYRGACAAFTDRSQPVSAVEYASAMVDAERGMWQSLIEMREDAEWRNRVQVAMQLREFSRGSEPVAILPLAIAKAELVRFGLSGIAVLCQDERWVASVESALAERGGVILDDRHLLRSEWTEVAERAADTNARYEHLIRSTRLRELDDFERQEFLSQWRKQCKTLARLTERSRQAEHQRADADADLFRRCLQYLPADEQTRAKGAMARDVVASAMDTRPRSLKGWNADWVHDVASDIQTLAALCRDVPCELTVRGSAAESRERAERLLRIDLQWAWTMQKARLYEVLATSGPGS